MKALHVRWKRTDVPLLASSTPEHASAEVKRHFERWCGELSIPITQTPEAESAQPSAELIESSGDQIDQLMVHALLADLIVLCRPAADFGLLPCLALEAVLFDGGRPVLLIPPGFSGNTFANPIIAWNGSLQSSRALGMGLPIIKECAGTAAILTVPEPGRSASATDVLTYLRWHRVNAEVVAPEAADAGRQLLELASRRNCGLIVSGAYARGRLRHALFGGVTSHLIDYAHLPVLMAH
jgi:nucleotide-binding universal stress UspA family protein